MPGTYPNSVSKTLIQNCRDNPTCKKTPNGGKIIASISLRISIIHLKESPLLKRKIYFSNSILREHYVSSFRAKYSLANNTVSNNPENQGTTHVRIAIKGCDRSPSAVRPVPSQMPLISSSSKNRLFSHTDF